MHKSVAFLYSSNEPTEKELKNHIVDKFSDPLMGARPLKRGIIKELEDPLCEEILSGRVNAGDTVKVNYKEEKVVFTK